MERTKPIKIDLKPRRLLVAQVFAVAFSPVVFILGDGIVCLTINQTTWWNSYWIQGLTLLYYGLSIVRVRTDEVAGTSVLEKPATEDGAGWFFRPLFLTRVDRFTRNTQQSQLPADEVMVFRDNDTIALPYGMVRPWRMTTKEGADNNDVLNRRLTLEPTISVIWQIESKGFWEFYINIPGDSPEEKRTVIVQQMADTAEALLGTIFGTKTVAELVEDREIIREKLDVALVKAVADWGITICQVNVQRIIPTRLVNEALEETAVAKARAQITLTVAGAAKRDAILRAEGERDAMTVVADGRIAQLTAEGIGLKAAATASGISVEELRRGEIAMGTLGDSRATFVLGTDGFRDVFATGAAIAAGAKKGGAK